MLHLLYILAFTIVAFFAISNLIRSLITLSVDSRRSYSGSRSNQDYSRKVETNGFSTISHPELLDNQGKRINEPLLVMRSVSVEDARQKLDAIYNSSPNASNNSNKSETEEDT